MVTSTQVDEDTRFTADSHEDEQFENTPVRRTRSSQICPMSIRVTDKMQVRPRAPKPVSQHPSAGRSPTPARHASTLTAPLHAFRSSFRMCGAAGDQTHAHNARYWSTKLAVDVEHGGEVHVDAD